MPVPVDSLGFRSSVMSRICEALVLLLKADSAINTYTGGRIYRHDPDALDEFLRVTTILVWPVAEQSPLGEVPAKFAHSTFLVAVTLYDDVITAPITAGTISSYDRRERIEIVIRAGTVVSAVAHEKLIDPYAPGGAPPTQLYLTDKEPGFTKGRPAYLANDGLPADADHKPAIAAWTVICEFANYDIRADTHDLP